ncbi:hypothetical protein K525DRAFT_279418 [Schizophyllum commune Loenen D]|nr:hypothetical protein K525DRAFT_279418 [Schizophyllum commune Loenen D]
MASAQTASRSPELRARDETVAGIVSASLDPHDEDNKEILAGYILKACRVGVRTTLSDCLALLRETRHRDDLWTELRQGKEQKDFTGVRVLVSSLMSERVHQSDDTNLSEDIYPYVESLAPKMLPDVVLQRFANDVWVPTTDANDMPMSSSARAFIEQLRIPLVKDRPSLLLHDLGLMDTLDPAFATRMEDVFKLGGVLINTSGAGKTRLLLEALCHHWGLYFVASRKGDRSSSALGSHDMNNAIDDHIPEGLSCDGLVFTERLSSEPIIFDSQATELVSEDPDVAPLPEPVQVSPSLEANRRIASRHLSDVLLARLLIFQRFLLSLKEHADMLPENHNKDQLAAYRQRCKKAWLLVQLFPSYIDVKNSDAFAHLVGKLQRLSTKRVVALLTGCLGTTRSLLVDLTSGNMEKCFLVLDEAQYAAGKWPDAFRCSKDMHARPVFREIIACWGNQILRDPRGEDFKVVSAGTAVDWKVAQESFSSALLKEDTTLDVLHGMGTFHDRDYMEYKERYLRRYLPLGYTDSPEGIRLLRRINVWLRGRPRILTGYLGNLMMHGYKNPHGVLNVYISRFSSVPHEARRQMLGNAVVKTADNDDVDLDSGIYPSDSAEFAEGGNLKIVPSMYPWRPQDIQDTGLLPIVCDVVLNVMLRSDLQSAGRMGSGEAYFVQHGIAYFNAQGKALIDEPVIVLTIMRWYDRRKYLLPSQGPPAKSTYFHIATRLRVTDARYNGFEEFLALALVDFVFAKPRPLNQVFTFTGSAPPSFADWEATLVGFYQPDKSLPPETGDFLHGRLRRPCFNIGYESDGFEKNISWMRHETGYQAILFPDRYFGPDLLMILRLRKGELVRYVWTAIQAKGRETPADVFKAVKTVTPLYFHAGSNEKELKQEHQAAYREALKALPDRHPDAGEHAVLRVIAAFPLPLEPTKEKTFS